MVSDFDEMLLLSDDVLLFLGVILIFVFNKWDWGITSIILGLLIMYSMGELSLGDLLGKKVKPNDSNVWR